MHKEDVTNKATDYIKQKLDTKEYMIKAQSLWEMWSPVYLKYYKS